jgi:putative oxidoreductase
MITDWAPRLAALLVGAFFLGFGIANARSSAAIIESLKQRNIMAPQALFWLGVSTQSLAGAMLMVGFQPALMAGGLVVFTLIAPLVFHNFWTMEGDARFLNRIIFICDYTCVLAALVLIAASDKQAWANISGYWWHG